VTESLPSPTAPSTPNGRARLLYIDLLRVVSMLMVFFHHIRAEIAPAKSWPPGFLNLGWGTLGVYIFILLSGFSLYLTANDQLSYRQFLKKRLLKIMIPYWVYFWGLFIVRIFEGSINYKAINYKFLVISLTSLDTFVNPFQRISVYCVTDWFVGFIVLMYLVAPFVFQLYQKFNGKLLIVFFIISSLILTQYHHPLVERLPIVQLFTFLFGIVIADITYRHFDLLKVSITFWCMFCGFIAISLLPGGTVYSLWLRTICFAVICVYLFKFIEENFIIIFKNSAVKTVISFGAQISFMYFLCHHQIIIYFKRYCMSGKFQCLHQPVVIAVCLLIVTILVSWLLNRVAQFFLARIQFEALGKKQIIH
jgi:peptidoglycan/LPS O-acetylase OafA/YrhL